MSDRIYSVLKSIQDSCIVDPTVIAQKLLVLMGGQEGYAEALFAAWENADGDSAKARYFDIMNEFLMKGAQAGAALTGMSLEDLEVAAAEAARSLAEKHGGVSGAVQSPPAA